MRNEISKVNREFSDRMAGIYCGIPLCCINFFVDESKNSPLVALRVGMSRGDWQSGNAGYVQCDVCHQENKAVELRGVGVGDTARLFFDGLLSVKRNREP